MGYKSKTIKCQYMVDKSKRGFLSHVNTGKKLEKCLNDEFFVTTLGIEMCSNCFGATMYITEATGSLSYKQIKLEEELEKRRQYVESITNSNTNQ